MDFNSRKLSMISMVVSLALLPLAGFTQQLAAADSQQSDSEKAKVTAKDEASMVVTVRVKTLQAPGVSVIESEEIKKTSAAARCLRTDQNHAGCEPDR